MITHFTVFPGKMRIFSFILGIIIALASLSACMGNSNTNNSTTQNTGPITIGISLSLTGNSSADGQAFKQGYQLWADQVNKTGGLLGHQVQLIILDDATNISQTRTNYEKLISVDHVNFTLGPSDDAFTVAGAEVAARHGYSLVEGAGPSPQDFTHGLTNIFSVSLPTTKYMGSFVNYILSLPASMRPKSVTYVSTDAPFTKTQIDSARPLLQQGGLTTALYDVYPAENTNFTPIAQKVVNSHADVVLIGSDGLADCAPFLKYFITHHYNPKLIIATAGPDQGSAFTDAIGKKNTEGMLVPNGGWWPGIKTYQNDTFVSAYVTKFGGTPDNISSDQVQAYSVGQVLQQAVNQAHSLDNAQIMSVLRSGTFQSLQGLVKFSADGQNSLAIAAYLFQWQKGQPIPVYPSAEAQANLEYPKPAWPS